VGNGEKLGGLDFSCALSSCDVVGGHKPSRISHFGFFNRVAYSCNLKQLQTPHTKST